MADIQGAQAEQKIGRQLELPFSKAFEIAWKGIRIRIWRSLITMSGIILAIAFLMSVWTSGVFNRALGRVGEGDELYPVVQGALEAEAIAGGAMRLRVVVLEERAEAGRVTPGTSMRGFLDAQDAFRAELIPAEADLIVGLLGADADSLPDAVVISGLPAVLSDADVSGALGRYARAGGFLVVYGTEGWAPGSALPLAEVLPATVTDGTPISVQPTKAAREPQSVQVGWQNLPAADFLRADGKAGAVAMARADGNVLGWTAAVGKGESAWFPVTAESARDPEVISWFARGRTTSEGAGEDLSTQSLLTRLIAHGAGETGTQRDMRGIWLVTLSLMVCVVGITNAMLMSVTERFREIGTMKCLGALDQFVVKLFLIESSLQGVVGSLCGAAIGFGLAFVRALFTFHVKDLENPDQSYWLVLRFFPALNLLAWFGIALAVGIVLSVIAAIYPAIRAARMEPVQAMRVEA